MPPLTPEEIKKQVIETSAIVENTLKSVASQIGDIFQDALSEADGITKIFGKDVQKQLNSLARSTDKMVENQIKIKQGQTSSKDIAKQLLEYEVKREVLEKRISNLMAEQPELAAQLAAQLADVDAANADYVEGLKEQEKELTRIENKMGLLGKLVKGLNKIPIIGNLIEADKVETEMKKAAAAGKSPFITGFKEVGKSIGKSLTDPLTILTFLVNAFNKADKQATELGKSLGVSKSQSLEIRNNFAAYSRSTSDTFVTTDRLMKAQAELSQQLGIAVQFSGQEAETFAKLTEIVGLSADEAGKLAKFSAATGMSSKEYVATIRRSAFAAQQANRVHFSDKEILQDISKLSAGILVKFQNNPKAIAEAVVQAKKLGLTLDQINKIGDTMLDWESSIENELKAELITGKQLNFERARAAALTGDQATLMQEVASQAGSLEEFSNMNVIAQKSLAEAFGMSREEMADMLLKQETINKYGDKAAELNAQQLKDFKDSGLSLDEYIQKQDEQRSIQDKFNDAILKLQDMLGNLVTGPFGSLLTILDALVSNAGVFYTILGSIGALLTGKMLMGLGQMVIKLGMALGLSTARAAAEVTAAEALSAGAVTFAIIGGLAAVMGALSAASTPKETKFAEGGIVTSEINNATIGEAGPEAIIPLNSSKASGMLGGGDNSGLMAAINELKNAVNALANKPQPAMALHVGAEKLGEVVGKQAETGTNQYKNAYRLA
jgi:DNA-binding ferritin-like protein (Dps family)